MLKERIEAVLARIRPLLQNDGGDVELVDVSEDGIVKVRLKGACAGCLMSQMTLKQGIEAALKQEIPEVKEVVSL
jgi:Fe-S cluster biogenesis protein NfuA